VTYNQNTLKSFLHIFIKPKYILYKPKNKSLFVIVVSFVDIFKNFFLFLAKSSYNLFLLDLSFVFAKLNLICMLTINFKNFCRKQKAFYTKILTSASVLVILFATYLAIINPSPTPVEAATLPAFGKAVYFPDSAFPIGYQRRIEFPIVGNKLNIGTTDFTIEFWMKVPSGVYNYTLPMAGPGWVWGNIILDRDIYGNYPEDFGISLYNGNIRFGTGPDPDVNTIQTSGVDVADGNWHHVAVVRTLSGQARIYVDGIQRASGNVQGGDISYVGPYGGGYINSPKCNENKDPYLVLGAEKHDYFWCLYGNPLDALDNAYSGYLDDLRISNVARYNSNFTVPTVPHPEDSNTVAIYRFDDNTANDATSSPVSGTVKARVTFVRDVPYGPIDCVAFADVPSTNSFYSYICSLRHDGIVDGYPGNVYKPNNFVTRGEMAKFIFLSSYLFVIDPLPLETCAYPDFPDVPVGAPFYKEIMFLRCTDIVSGYSQPSGPNIYKPNNFVTRGEMAKFIVNAFGIRITTPCGDFPDVNPSTPFYTEITILKCNDVVSGYSQPSGPNIYKPNNFVTRGEMAKFIEIARDLY